MKGWLHRILDVPADARGDELRSGYGAQLKRFHPDRCPDNPENRHRLGLIRVAHEVLRDDGYRKEHEKTGKIPGGVELGGPLQEHLKDAGALELAKGFLNAFQREKPLNGKNKVVRIDLTVEELMKGTSRLVDVKRSMPCSQCSGSGSEKSPPPLRCHACEATGTITWPGIVVRGMPCAFCTGKGLVILAPCIRCDGKAYELQDQPCRVTIPPGVPEGHRVVLRGEGERGTRGGKHGDLVLRLFLDERSRYRREGDDLWTDISLEANARSIQLSHPSGTLTVPVPQGFEGGVLIAAGHGLPTKSDPKKFGVLKIRVTYEPGGEVTQ